MLFRSIGTGLVIAKRPAAERVTATESQPNPERAARPGMRPRMDNPRALLSEMTAAMKLSPAQQESIEKLLETRARQLREQRKKGLQERLAAFEEVASIIRTNLTPQQLGTYDKSVQQTRQRFTRALRDLDSKP